MKEHGKKMIAPIVVSLCIVLYYAAAGAFLFILDAPAPLKIAILVVSVGASALLIKVVIERITEIRKGEEDDLGNY